MNASEELRLRYRYLDLRRPEMAQSLVAAERDDGAAGPRRRGLPRGRNADADEVDPRGGARLPRSVAGPRGRVLRAAAVAAALQAAADGRGDRPLLPDGAMLPRRGPARRPAAGVYADRRRDVVPDRGRSTRSSRRSSGSLPGRRHRLPGSVSANDLRRGDAALRHRPPRYPLRAGAGPPLPGLRGEMSSRAGDVKGLCCPAAPPPPASGSTTSRRGRGPRGTGSSG